MKRLNKTLATGTLCATFLCATTTITAHNHTALFNIGIADNNSSEFALYPDQKTSFLASFGGEHAYYVGYSTPAKHWPFALPGPMDSWGGGGYWAGFHPRHFPSFYFNLSKAPSKGESTFLIAFTEVNNQHATTLRIEINGHRQEYDLNASSQEINARFPSAWLKQGMNTIRMGIVKGGSVQFDHIALTAPDAVLASNATSTLIKNVKAAPFEYANAASGNRKQPILFDLVQFDRPTDLTFKIDGYPAVTKRIEPGKTIQEIDLPALTDKKQKEKLNIVVTEQGNTLYKGSIKRSKGALHQPADFVDLLMGTGNSRWMFKPGPTLPFGMVQIAPDNQDETWKAGYEYSIENIAGFNHFCDWTMTGPVVQPTCGALQTTPGRETQPDEGYRSRIDKSSEEARVGHYSVFMTDTKIKAEVTSTRRAALQRYTFPKHEQARILIDLFTPNEYPHNLVNAEITCVSDHTIEGFATYYNAFTGYSLEQNYTVYFVFEFSKPFQSVDGWTNEGVEPVTGYIGNWNRNHQHATADKVVSNITQLQGKGDMGISVNFNTADQEEILVRSSVSLVDLNGARNNLLQELAQPFGWDFEAVVQNSRSIWNDYLSRIEIETDDYLQKCKFYTNLYRALAAKAIWSDYDGRYTDEEENIKQLPDPERYIVSGEYWNTFWDNQQLFNLMAPELSETWAHSAIELYKNSGWYNTDPAGIEHTGVMVAMHVASQIMGAWQSGIRSFSLDTAYTGIKKMLTTPPQRHPGGGTVGVEHLVPYMEYGYIPQGKGYVSNTLEYAYDDWCAAQMAKALGKEDDYAYFLKRSENWKNLLDPQSGFIRPKDEQGNWIEPFDPYHTPGFVEGNAFNYSWFAPHDPEGLVAAIGQERFVGRLDSAMAKSARANFNAAGDNFGDFPVNQGNQTSMQVAYLFNWAKAPWLTQKWSRAIQEQYYGTTPYDAYPGDEDLGQMSSWYILSALGLFQLDGGCSQTPHYELASPRFPKAVIHFGNKYNRGDKLEIIAHNASKENKYIQRVQLNGKPITSFRIPQSELFKGGTLEIVMGPQPNKSWGIEKSAK